MTFTVVPYDYDLEANPSNIAYHGVFISNGPGDPAMCTPTIKSLRWLMKKAADGEKPVPIFGICLGNQLLALAAGAKVRAMATRCDVGAFAGLRLYVEVGSFFVAV